MRNQLLISQKSRVILTDKSERSESTDILAAKLKRELEEKYTGVEFKSAPIGLMGAEGLTNRNGGYRARCSDSK